MDRILNYEFKNIGSNPIKRFLIKTVFKNT